MTTEATKNFFKVPEAVAAAEAEARRQAVEAFIARGGTVKILAPAPTPRRMTANP